MPAGLDEPGRRAYAHAERFNAAAASGDWVAFAQRFAADAQLRFPNTRIPPSCGRDAVLAAYEAHPPDAILAALDVGGDPSDPDLDVVRFGWASGGSGTMRLRWRGELVAELEVTFG